MYGKYSTSILLLITHLCAGIIGASLHNRLLANPKSEISNLKS